MSVLLSREEENKETPKWPLLASETEQSSPKNGKHKPRDSIKHVNEKSDKEEVICTYLLDNTINYLVDTG